MTRRRCGKGLTADVMEDLIRLLGRAAPASTTWRRSASFASKGPALTLPPNQPPHRNVLEAAAAYDHPLAATGASDVRGNGDGEGARSRLGAVTGQVHILSLQKVVCSTAPQLQQANSPQPNPNVARTLGAARRITATSRRENRRSMTRRIIEKPMKNTST